MDLQKLAKENPKEFCDILLRNFLPDHQLTFALEYVGLLESISGGLLELMFDTLDCHERSYVREGAILGLIPHMNENIANRLKKSLEIQTDSIIIDLIKEELEDYYESNCVIPNTPGLWEQNGTVFDGIENENGNIVDADTKVSLSNHYGTKSWRRLYTKDELDKEKAEAYDHGADYARKHRQMGVSYEKTYLARIAELESAVAREQVLSDNATGPLHLKIEELEAKVAEQKRQITIAREGAERRNRELDALSIVWCSGGCAGGMKPDREVTAEHVAFLYLNASRAEDWYVNAAGNQLPGTVEARQPAWDEAKRRVSAAITDVQREETRRAALREAADDAEHERWPCKRGAMTFLEVAEWLREKSEAAT